MEAFRESRGTFPLILNFGSRWGWAVCFDPGKKPCYPLNRRLGGSRDFLDILPLPRPNPGLIIPYPSLCTAWSIPAFFENIDTALFREPFRQYNIMYNVSITSCITFYRGSSPSLSRNVLCLWKFKAWCVYEFLVEWYKTQPTPECHLFLVLYY